MKWTDPAFKELQKAWYQRLEATGFVDAEEIVGGELELKQSAAHPYRDTDEIIRKSKEDYFRFLAQRAQESQFRNEIDRLILIKRAEGERIKHICEALITRGSPRCRFSVRLIIRRYEMLWGLRQYSPKQLGKKVS